MIKCSSGIFLCSHTTNTMQWTTFLINSLPNLQQCTCFMIVNKCLVWANSPPSPSPDQTTPWWSCWRKWSSWFWPDQHTLGWTWPTYTGLIQRKTRNSMASKHVQSRLCYLCGTASLCELMSHEPFIEMLVLSVLLCHSHAVPHSYLKWPGKEAPAQRQRVCSMTQKKMFTYEQDA